MADRGNPATGTPGARSDRGFKGNKASLPVKPCQACGRPMSWRRRWAATWNEVRYCSDACRRQRRAIGGERG
jgi:hypothetical protein